MKTAVILVTLGGPRAPEEIPEFIRNFVGRELPPPALKAVIERYRLIGGFSPLACITEEQARVLEEALGGGYFCLPAFRHVRPSIESALDNAAAQGAERILFLLLSPFYTSVTTGNYIDVAKAHIARISLSTPVDFIHSWYGEPLFIESWVEQIRGGGIDERAFYLFSAHSLPLKYADEPYRRQIEETVERVAASAGIRNHALGWQSIPERQPEPWITPIVEDKIDFIAASGFKEIIQVPIGFTADHIETLFDIDITHRQYALAKGLSFRRIASLNAGAAFIRALKEVVTKFEHYER
ncbi:MAG: ferrochelatase [Syntrophobacterales bacterium]|nr:ferrochelatase [Syntrophobacterales bacterium]